MHSMKPCLATGLLALLVAGQATADDRIGPQGALGPSGHLGPTDRPAAAQTRPVQPPSRAAQSARGPGNHVEASGNRASAIRCGPQGAAVHSVDVRGAQLSGRTVVVQERNAQHVDTRDCPAPEGAPAPTPQVNSIRIR